MRGRLWTELSSVSPKNADFYVFQGFAKPAPNPPIFKIDASHCRKLVSPLLKYPFPELFLPSAVTMQRQLCTVNAHITNPDHYAGTTHHFNFARYRIENKKAQLVTC